MAKISVKNIFKKFGKTSVLENINLDIQDKEFVVLLGPSGCGKTTLLNIIAGLEKETSGEILIDDILVNSLAPGKRDIGFVFQNYALYPNKSVYDNLAFSLKFRDINAIEFEKEHNNTPSLSKKMLVDNRVREIASILQIEDLLKSKPNQLSGGQRQRVAMGRAMVRKPRAFLFDEPLSNLDAILRVSMRQEIKELHRKLGATVVYVTHDQVEAMTLADRIVVINEGKILQVGKPKDIYDKPENVFVAKFVGSPSMNLIETELSEINGRMFLSFGPEKIPLPAIIQDKYRKLKGQNIFFGIRPENIALEDRFSVSCKILADVVDREFLGNNVLLHASIGSLRLAVSLDNGTVYNKGDKVPFFLNMSRFSIFDKDTGKLISTE